MKKKSTKGTRTDNKTESLAKKYEKMLQTNGYLDVVDDLSDDEVKELINGRAFKGVRRQRIVNDAASGGIPQPEYNGPIPLGFREIPPSSILQSFKGPVGKAVRHFGARNFFLGDQINAWFDQNCFVNKATSMPGEDAVAPGFVMKPRGKADKKLVQELDDLFHMEQFNLNMSMREFDHNKRCFGAAIMIPCFEDDVDMSTPLIDYSALKGKNFIGWTNVEPYYITPYFDENDRSFIDPTYKFFGVPTHWDMNNSGITKRIHRSWIFFRRNVFTSKIYQPMYKWQGPSVPQMILERLYSAEVCANESSMLLRSKRTFVMEANISQLAANPEYARKFLKNCSANSDNWGVRIVPRNSNARQMDSYLSECMPLTTAQYGILCAEVDIPAPKFMMAQLTGFANSGNYEVKLYAQKERNLQVDELVPIVKQSIRFVTACSTGKPIEFDVSFNDVDVPTITEKADMMYEEARASKFIEEAKALRRNKVEEKKPITMENHHSVEDRT